MICKGDPCFPLYLCIVFFLLSETYMMKNVTGQVLKMVSECVQTYWCDFVVSDKMGPTKLVCL